MLVIVRLANQLARVAWAAQAKERFTGLQPWRRKAIRQEAWGGRKESIGAQWMRDGIGKPVFILHRARLVVMDPICELPYGAAAMIGRMTGRTDVSTRTTPDANLEDFFGARRGAHRCEKGRR